MERFKRFASTTSAKKSFKKPYEYTVNLPRTAFPMRANAVQNEHRYRERTTNWLYQWQQNNSTGRDFILHDGPPYANGDLHLGHALNKCLKDFINRYQILKGRRVHYIPGWDCHGLPIELKALQHSSSSDSKSKSPETIRARARKFALDAVEKQKASFQEWAILADWENSYLTLQPEYEARQIQVFGKMLEKGLIYRKHRPVYWSPSSRTALAEAELEYNENHVSRSVYVKFPLVNEKNAYALVWTTTPWTLPANKALCINPELQYSKVVISANGITEAFYMAKNRAAALEDKFEGKTIESVTDIDAESMLLIVYEHPLTGAKGKILGADFVTEDTGTGIVHLAPGHGHDDYIACLAHGIEAFCPVDAHGKYTSDVPKYQGMDVFKDGNEAVIQDLIATNRLILEEKHKHKYPYDWRTKKPVLIRATSQWFADVTQIKQSAVDAIEKVQIVPQTGRRRLSSHVLARDEWCISRQRAWGVPIPAFYHNETGEAVINAEIVGHVGSLIAQHGSDVWWKMTVEELLPDSQKHLAQDLIRGNDTMDVWFDSGTSWTLLPRTADVYLEGSDQHRGWFQSSLLTSVAVNGISPFQNLITHGFVMDERGRKMSKSLGNVIDPSYITQAGKNKQSKKQNLAYGVDVMRLWAAMSDYHHDVNVGDGLLKTTADTVRKLRNTMRFMISNLYDFELNKAVPDGELLLLDRYMLQLSSQMFQQVDRHFESFEFGKASQLILNYAITEMSSFYLDVTKDRLYNDAADSIERRSAQTALSFMLRDFVTICAPITPHLSEELFTHLKPMVGKLDVNSVFQLGWPKSSEDASLLSDFARLREMRTDVLKSIEELRSTKAIGASIEADVELVVKEGSETEQLLKRHEAALGELFQCASLKISTGNEDAIRTTKASKYRCIRCWKHTASSTEEPCSRCSSVISQFPQQQPT